MANNPTLFQRSLVEALGAFLLVFLGGASIIISGYYFPGSAQLLVIALAHGLALALAVSIAMNISGGHINPAVTIAMLATKRIKAPDAAAYIFSQVAGATVGAFVLLILPASIIGSTLLGSPTLSPQISVVQGIGIEALITFVLVTAVFGTAVDSRAPKMAGFGIGLALTLGILFAGPLTGAAANPARALGPEIVTMNFSNWYIYWIGPIIGALIAAFIFQYLIMPKGKSGK